MPVRESAGEESGPVGAGLTAAKMTECPWLKPQLVGQFEFVEWTADDHLRHGKFITLGMDKCWCQAVFGIGQRSHKPLLRSLFGIRR